MRQIPSGSKRSSTCRIASILRSIWAGFAIAGGLFVVPTFAAVQAWAGADRPRLRVIAAVNVLNAAFMVVWRAATCRLCKSWELGVPASFMLLGERQPRRRDHHRAHHAGELDPVTLPRSFSHAFYGLEVKGLENIDKAGGNAIIALNHVSFLDAPLAMTVLPKRPVFAIDVAMSKHWWIKPFTSGVRTMALDPLKPYSLRAIIDAVKNGNRLVIFPEGRITLTGSLMKIYDGVALIADRADAMVVPVRVDGPERTTFSRLTRAQVRRRHFPKITVTILEPVKPQRRPRAERPAPWRHAACGRPSTKSCRT